MLVVWKLDRLGRNLAHLVTTVQDLSARGVGLRVLAGDGAQIDTTTAAGRLVFGIFAALGPLRAAASPATDDRRPAAIAATKRRWGAATAGSAAPAATPRLRPGGTERSRPRGDAPAGGQHESALGNEQPPTNARRRS